MESLRAEFPVLEHTAYLNAGTNGPVPRRALDAAAESLRTQAEDGRGGGPFFEPLLAVGRRSARAGAAACSAATQARSR